MPDPSLHGRPPAPGGPSTRRSPWVAALIRALARLLVVACAVLLGSCATQQHGVGAPAIPSRPLAPPTPAPRVFAGDAPLNEPLPPHPRLDPRSAAIVSALNAGEHNADFVQEGSAVYDAGAATQTAHITCTQRRWGPCPLQGVTLRVDRAWKPQPGSDRSMVVIDYRRRVVYDLWHVSTTGDGTVAVSRDGEVGTAWGSMTSLDGSGQSIGATGSGLSHLYGMVWVSEAQEAVAVGGCGTESRCPLVDVISHALHFATDITCPTSRPPALKSDGVTDSAYCIPEGTRVFLGSDANCAFDPTQPIEEAVCFALKRYGAFATDTSGSRFALGFEAATPGLPGGTGPSPYFAGGLLWDYYDMNEIPWSHLHVLAGP